MDVARQSFDGSGAGSKASRFHTPSSTTVRFSAKRGTKPASGSAQAAEMATPAVPANPMAKPFKKSKNTLLFSIVAGVILIVGLVAAVSLASLQQDVRQQAKEGSGPYLNQQCLAKLGFEKYTSGLDKCKAAGDVWNDKTCTCNEATSAVISDDSKLDGKTNPSQDPSSDKGGILAKEGICGPGHRSWVASQKVCKTGVVQNK